MRRLTHRAGNFDDQALHVSDDLHELRLFLGPYLVLVQRCDEQVVSDLPVGFGDADVITRAAID